MCLTLLVVVVHEVDVEPQDVEERVPKRESDRLLVLDVEAGVERDLLVQEAEEFVHQVEELPALVVQKVRAVLLVPVSDL